MFANNVLCFLFTTKYVYIKSATVYDPSSELGLSLEPEGGGGEGPLACG
jgi:hypothetical protein